MRARRVKGLRVRGLTLVDAARPLGVGSIDRSGLVESGGHNAGHEQRERVNSTNHSGVR